MAKLSNAQMALQSGRMVADTLVGFIFECDAASRPAMIERCTTQFLNGQIVNEARMSLAGYDPVDIREMKDAATIGFSDRLVELLT
jgi:hypothetical protein